MRNPRLISPSNITQFNIRLLILNNVQLIDAIIATVIVVNEYLWSNHWVSCTEPKPLRIL